MSNKGWQSTRLFHLFDMSRMKQSSRLPPFMTWQSTRLFHLLDMSRRVAIYSIVCICLICRLKGGNLLDCICLICHEGWQSTRLFHLLDIREDWQSTRLPFAICQEGWQSTRLFNLLDMSSKGWQSTRLFYLFDLSRRVKQLDCFICDMSQRVAIYSIVSFVIFKQMNRVDCHSTYQANETIE